jgi:hypothetical protein
MASIAIFHTSAQPVRTIRAVSALPQPAWALQNPAKSANRLWPTFRFPDVGSLKNSKVSLHSCQRASKSESIAIRFLQSNVGLYLFPYLVHFEFDFFLSRKGLRLAVQP